MNSTEKPQDYSLSLHDRGEFLHASIQAHRETLQMATACWMEIAEAVTRSGHKKLLIVEDIPDAISIAEVHELVTTLADLPLKDIRVAFVDLHKDHASLNEFAVLVGENRGFNVKAFETEAAAESWLLR